MQSTCILPASRRTEFCHLGSGGLHLVTRSLVSPNASPGARPVLSVLLSSATTIAVLDFANPSLQTLCFHSLQTPSYVVPCHLVMIELRSTSISNVTLWCRQRARRDAGSQCIAQMWQLRQRIRGHDPRISDRIPSALNPTCLYLPPCLMTQTTERTG
ncbi:hypothetical protein AC579_6773 [Pseudocercospora musae]|uniref:Uncharacterized protein n=1 Tax=Pseudocercospora musae TaxID=113226 RepID=A0A139I3I2_9PEZI|nr:hypothetical protein AC579_6773 [Pseudocercospora musae]